jgi:hypothetical protein
MSKNKLISFGVRGEIPKNAEESRVIPFILSTSRKDRHGTVLNQDNWLLENYRNNPIVAYQHNLSGGMCSDPNPDFVIGKSIIDLEGNAMERRLVAEGEFEPADINPMAEKIFRKVLFGSLSRTSVGFLEIGEGIYGQGDQARDQTNETYFFAGQELLEWSVVNVPSNPDAGKRDLVLHKMREEGYSALMYAFKELGGKFRLSQIEQFSVRQVLDLLEGKDLEIKETDPEKVRRLLAENEAQKDQIQRLTTLMQDRKVSR